MAHPGLKKPKHFVAQSIVVCTTSTATGKTTTHHGARASTGAHGRRSHLGRSRTWRWLSLRLDLRWVLDWHWGAIGWYTCFDWSKGRSWCSGPCWLWLSWSCHYRSYVIGSRLIIWGLASLYRIWIERSWLWNRTIANLTTHITNARGWCTINSSLNAWAW